MRQENKSPKVEALVTTTPPSPTVPGGARVTISGAANNDKAANATTIVPVCTVIKADPTATRVISAPMLIVRLL